MQNSVRVRNGRLDSFETIVGTAPVLEFRAGAMPANCAAASTGAQLASGALPSDWLAAAANGLKAKNGTWTLTGIASGVIGYYRLYAAGSPSECDEQGTVGEAGSPTYDMTVDNLNVAAAQVVTVTAYNRTAGNA